MSTAYKRRDVFATAAQQKWPDCFVCPITLEPIGHPVRIAWGHNKFSHYYEQAPFKQALQRQCREPLTRQYVDNHTSIEMGEAPLLHFWYEVANCCKSLAALEKLKKMWLRKRNSETRANHAAAHAACFAAGFATNLKKSQQYSPQSATLLFASFSRSSTRMTPFAGTPLSQSLLVSDQFKQFNLYFQRCHWNVDRSNRLP